MEKIISSPFEVYVDYAFTPNALEQVYKTLQTTNYKLQTKLICVLGSCGGGRDKWKRPVLGQIARKYCDIVIITNEDPYDEDPMQIINQVAKGAQSVQHSVSDNSDSKSLLKILDRREAINKALSLAKPGDKVIITGKGNEPWLCIAGGKKIPWDDREIVREEYNKLKSYSRP
jgi:UDP-N-acetylmuramyl tripeptide synthase